MNDNTAAMPQQIPPEAILSQMLWGGLIQQSIYAIAKLGIADFLAKKPQTADELAAETGMHAPSLYRVLRTLASVGIFAENADEKFELTPVAEPLRRDAANSMRDFALMLGGEWHWRMFGEVMHSVKTGATAQEKACGAELFEYLANNAEDAEVFNRAMTSHSLAAVPAIVEGYDFSGIGKLVDIGGGQGILLAGILKANPQMQGILFDMLSVIARESDLLEQEGVAARVEKVAGDFFRSVPAGADAYLMKHIIHDWTDEQSIKILQNIGSAISGSGKVLIVEMVVPEGNEPSPSKILDLQMLIGTGGKERTEKEYRELLGAAGFRLNRVVATRSPLSVVEAEKN